MVMLKFCMGIFIVKMFFKDTRLDCYWKTKTPKNDISQDSVSNEREYFESWRFYKMQKLVYNISTRTFSGIMNCVVLKATLSLGPHTLSTYDTY
jgi:hypothetical protein